MRILPFDNDGLGSLDYVGDRDGFEQYRDSNSGECFQLENGEYVLTDCAAARPRYVVGAPAPWQTVLPPATLPTIQGGNLATVTTYAPHDNTLLYLAAAGVLVFFLLKQ